jgi:hypothetical protein
MLKTRFALFALGLLVPTPSLFVHRSREEATHRVVLSAGGRDHGCGGESAESGQPWLKTNRCSVPQSL